MTATDPPLALQLAARVEKAGPPTVTDLCRATALATIALLDDPRARPGGTWHHDVTAWNGARIRKLVRRGRGVAWDRAQEPDGVTVSVGAAEVRAYVPGPMDQVPPPLAKLQIQFTPLPAPISPTSPASPPSGALVVAVTPQVEMSWGKQAAQCAHAAQRAWMTAPAELRSRWDGAGRPLEVLVAPSGAWPELTARADVQIRDGGYTEIPAGTLTAVAWWDEPFAPRSDQRTMPHQLLLLDLDGVIRHFDPKVNDVLEIQHGLTPGALAQAAFAEPHGSDVIRGRLSRADWVAAVGEAVGAPAAARAWLGTRGVPDPEMVDVIARVRSLGVPVALLTNGTDTIHRELEELHLADLADAVFCSALTGHAKPEPASYLHACAEMGVDPDRVLFFDDTVANVTGAAEVGLDAHLFRSPAQVAAALRP